MIGFENYVIFIGTLKPDAPISVFLLILLEDTDALKPRDVSAIWILGNNIDEISRFWEVKKLYVLSMGPRFWKWQQKVYSFNSSLKKIQNFPFS